MEDILKQIIISKIKNDDSRNFTLKEIENIKNRYRLNDDLISEVLGINKKRIRALILGKINSVSSKKYFIEKENYINNIRTKVIEDIMINKMGNDFTSKFSYSEIEDYEIKYSINKKDFLNYILEIKDYRRGPKSKEDSGYFYYSKYKHEKEEYLERKGDSILEEIVPVRMKKTGDYMFTYDEIKEISKIYKITPRDFMVYVLDKSEQLYYYFVSGRQDRCYSQKYKEKKEELIVEKRENFIKDINSNIRIYFSMDQIKDISEELDITPYDLVTNVMNRSRQSYYNLKKGVEIDKNKNKRIFIG